MNHWIETWQAQVSEAAANARQLRIRGHGTKDFYGAALRGDVLDVSGFSGVVNYEPTELVITARCGTPLGEVEALLAEKGQSLPFEAPHYLSASQDSTAGGSTLGGAVAAGLSGPARASVGSLRDYVLGASLINGRGEHLAFGGQVIKNVAGYDVSRLVAGSLGTLGIITEVSLKVLPIAVASSTLRFEMTEDQALRQLNAWGGQPLPINASAWWQGALVVRLAGAQAAVASAMQKLGGETIAPSQADVFWRGLRDQTDAFFSEPVALSASALWRLSVPSNAAPMNLGDTLIEWGGAQRWVRSDKPLFAQAAAVGGHATCFRGGERSAPRFQPLDGALARVNAQVKAAFDPHGVFASNRNQ
jgi:glycolate oxidase FAD binding subunit